MFRNSNQTKIKNEPEKFITRRQTNIKKQDNN